MVYGQVQYCNDEVRIWSRTVVLHKEELHSLLRFVNIVLNYPVVSLPDAKAGNAFIDRLIMHEQKMDHLAHGIGSQMLRLERTMASDSFLEDSMIDTQNMLRARMRSSELSFTRTKYACASFVSSFLHLDLLDARHNVIC